MEEESVRRKEVRGLRPDDGRAARGPPLSGYAHLHILSPHPTNAHVVRRSLAENDLTVLSIFVNPAQFAPHEDLATYPRTLPGDLALLHALSVPTPSGPRGPAAVFVPTVGEMYPAGISQDVEAQKGTFIEVKGYGHQMEGASRPTFFRGVATVVTKLFNAIEVSVLPHSSLERDPYRSPRTCSQRVHTLARRTYSKLCFYAD